MVSEREYCGHRRFPLLTEQPSIAIFPQPVTFWIGSTPSRWFAQGLTLVRRELQHRQPPGVKPAFEPDLFRARFALLKRHDHLTRTRTGDTSTGYSPLTRVFGWPGTLYKSSTASIRLMTSKAPSTLSNASLTSTNRVRFPSTTTPWTPSSTGQTRS